MDGMAPKHATQTPPLSEPVCKKEIPVPSQNLGLRIPRPLGHDTSPCILPERYASQPTFIRRLPYADNRRGRLVEDQDAEDLVRNVELMPPRPRCGNRAKVAKSKTL